MNSFQHFGVIGAGAWGTALAQTLRCAGRDVTLWAREAEVVEAIRSTHLNRVYLPQIPLDEELKATNDLAALSSCDVLLLVVPVQHMRSVCQQLTKVGLGAQTPILVCSKGIEIGTLKFPSQIIEETLSGHPVAVLSGPSFAIEVASDLPTAVTLACRDEDLATFLCHAISSRNFRPYSATDVIGAQIGGAIKNVLAVATGIATGCQMGENARAALITRGLAEMMRVGSALGGRAETMMGLSGLGDLVLTCSSTQSRNMSLGYALGQGRKLADILAERKSVAEGVPTSAAAAALAKRLGIDMPIVQATDAILNKGADVQTVIAGLLARPIRAEVG
ncbi:MAG: NAD(P)-dependent glycerol-3-phosphate dehydrogenase [Proteobacteria bacterium]|nr:NAD(P)-dependent glycerol-3-phosphate dehydrogenase [Pseudomonadota bacterium]